MPETALTMNLALQKSKAASPEHVRTLNVCGAQLNDISVCGRFPNVQVISLSVNEISDLSCLRQCQHLRELFLRKNYIEDIRQVLNLSDCLELRQLTLMDNPIAKQRSYREFVIAAIPSLEILDNVAVGPDERRRAEQMMPGVVGAQPPGPPARSAAPSLHRNPEMMVKPVERAPPRNSDAFPENYPQGMTASFGNDDVPVGGRAVRARPQSRQNYGNDDVPVGGGPVTRAHPQPAVRPPVHQEVIEHHVGGQRMTQPLHDASRQRHDVNRGANIPEQAAIRACMELMRDMSSEGLNSLRCHINTMIS